jgi:hypothetical protein
MAAPVPGRFRTLAMNPDNKMIGDFLHVADVDLDSNWVRFYDGYGSSVRYGKTSSFHEVVITLDYSSASYLKLPLLEYLTALVGLHGEQLHKKGWAKFRHLAITLPEDIVEHEQHVEIKLHTAGSTEYHQRQLAYEVMAALSGVPVLKAIAPLHTCGRFVRKDKIGNTGKIRYFDAARGISVKISHEHDEVPIEVSMFSKDHRNQANRALFQEHMYSFLEGYIRPRRTRPFVRGPGCYTYEGRQSSSPVKIDIKVKQSFIFDI